GRRSDQRRRRGGRRTGDRRDGRPADRGGAARGVVDRCCVPAPVERAAGGDDRTCAGSDRPGRLARRSRPRARRAGRSRLQLRRGSGPNRPGRSRVGTGQRAIARGADRRGDGGGVPAGARRQRTGVDRCAGRGGLRCGLLAGRLGSPVPMAGGVLHRGPRWNRSGETGAAAGRMEGRERFVTDNALVDCAVGCLTGAAVGDALGGATEGWSPQQIRQRWGGWVEGIVPPYFEDWKTARPIAPYHKGDGHVTDDTLMTHLLVEVYEQARSHLSAYDVAERLVPLMIGRETWIPELEARALPLQRVFL